MASLAILSGLGYIFMGCGSLLSMIGIFVAVGTDGERRSALLGGLAAFLLGAGFALLAHGISICFWPR